MSRVYEVELEAHPMVPASSGRVRMNLDERQADGLTCLLCGRRGGVTYPIGRVVGGSQVFAHAEAAGGGCEC